MVVFGSLVQSTEPEGLDLSERASFTGIGFTYKGIPIDVIVLFLAGIETKEYKILLVDEFQRFNNVAEENIKVGLQKIKRALDALSKLYGFEPEVIVSSDFMRSRGYSAVFNEIEERINDLRLSERVLQTVPVKFRTLPNAAAYPINEIACVEYLRREKKIEIKLGPLNELVYDRLMRELRLPVDFAYVIDAYALGTRQPEKVIHYIPTHNGATNGTRLLLEDPLDKSSAKLLFGPEEASRYLLKVASASGYRLELQHLTEEEIENVYGKKLKKVARHFVLENILKPYKKVAQDEF